MVVSAIDGIIYAKSICEFLGCVGTLFEKLICVNGEKFDWGSIVKFF